MFAPRECLLLAAGLAVGACASGSEGPDAAGGVDGASAVDSGAQPDAPRADGGASDAALADAILATLDNPPDKEILRKRGAEFSLERSVERHLEVLLKDE